MNVLYYQQNYNSADFNKVVNLIEGKTFITIQTNIDIQHIINKFQQLHNEKHFDLIVMDNEYGGAFDIIKAKRMGLTFLDASILVFEGKHDIKENGDFLNRDKIEREFREKQSLLLSDLYIHSYNKITETVVNKYKKDRIDYNEKITLLMPYKDDEKYLPDMFESILKQSYKNYELLIVDDSTTESSINYLNYLQDECKFVRVIRGDGQGVSAALNKGLACISTEYFIQVDSDNWLHTNFIRTMVSAITNCGASVITCYNEAFVHNPMEDGRLWRPPGQVKSLMPIENCVGDACAIYTTRDIRIAGGFPDLPRRVPVDWIMWNKLTSLGYKIYSCPQVLFSYRVREDGHSHNLDYYTCVENNLKYLVDGDAYNLYHLICSAREERDVVLRSINDALDKLFLTKKMKDIILRRISR